MIYMKPTPFADVILTHPLKPNESIATYCPTNKLLMFTQAASNNVIKLTGEWQCISICTHDHPNITLDLEDFDAPDLTHIVGNETLTIYNWNFEKEYDSHESVSPISTVRNIYNSRIVVLRPHDPLDSEYHNIGEIYGNMRFCEIELTYAPAGCRCIGEVMPGAKICSNNTLSSCPDDIEPVPCSDLAVTLTSPSSPVTTVYGLPPTFTAETNKDANITFYLNNDEVHSEIGTTEASYTPERYVEPDTYSVTVVATDVNDVHEPDQETCIWIVEAPPLVTMHCTDPLEIDHIGSSRTFSATINADSKVTATLIPNSNLSDSIVVLPSRMVAAGEEIEFTLDSNNIEGLSESKLVGTHRIMVEATNSSGFGSGVGICTWALRPPWTQLHMKCPDPFDVRMAQTFTAFIDQEAEIIIKVLDDQNDEVTSDSGVGESFSFTPKGLEPGTYTVCAVANNGLELSNEECCTLVVKEVKLLKVHPDRELVIDVWISEAGIGGARHRFEVETSEVGATVEMDVVDLSDDSQANFEITPPSTIWRRTARTIAVFKAGIYRVTARAEFQNGLHTSVSWIWVVRDDVSRKCSTHFFYDGPHIENGFYMHRCRTDMEDQFSPLAISIEDLLNLNFSLDPSWLLDPMTLLNLALTYSDYHDALYEFFKKGSQSAGKVLLGVIGGLITLLETVIVATYWYTHNEDDRSLDLFIPEESFPLILEAIRRPMLISSSLPIPVRMPIFIPIRLGKYDTFILL